MVPLAETALKRHFRKRPLQDLITASRTFPVTARVDVQFALDKMFAEHPRAKLVGVHTQYQHETLTVAHLLGNQHFPVVIGPLQNKEIDIGETLPARCLRQGLWLVKGGAAPFALLLSSAFRFGHAEGTHIEIAVPPGEAGSQLSRRLFDELEALVRQTASYRGKVISLESPDRYSGHHGPLRVHKLRNVQPDEVILRRRRYNFSIGISGTLSASVSGSRSSACLSRRVSSFMGHPERGRPTQFTIWPANCQITRHSWLLQSKSGSWIAIFSLPASSSPR